MKKEIKKAMGVSPVTGRIYYGNPRGDEWVGDKEDVTDTAVRAVFEWFIEKFEDVSVTSSLSPTHSSPRRFP